MCLVFLAKHKTLGYVSEKGRDSFHSSINKQLPQYQSIRNQSEKLVHVVKNQELLNTANRRLSKVTPKLKCDSCNVYLQKGVCPQCQRSKKTPTKLLHSFPKQGSHEKWHTISLYYCRQFVFLSLKRTLGNCETIILLFFEIYSLFYNVILLFRKIGQTLDITKWRTPTHSKSIT